MTSQKSEAKLTTAKLLKTYLSNLQTFFFVVFVFLLPSQLAYHFWPKYAFIFGIKTDYLAPALYLSDIVVILIFLVWLGEWILGKKRQTFFLKQVKKVFVWLIPILLIVVLNIIFANIPQVALYKWVKVVEVSLLAIFISKKDPFCFKKEIVYPIMFSCIFFGLLGIMQFVFQKTLGGYFYYLGERTFRSSTPGIALIYLYGHEYLRVYSTFPHPNALAGYFSVVLSLVWLSKNKKRVSQKYFRATLAIFTLIASTCLILTFSRTAVVVIVLAVLLYFFRKNLTQKIIYIFLFGYLVLSLAQPFIINLFFQKNLMLGQSLTERLYLLSASRQIISQHFLLGVGLNNFIPELARLYQIHAGHWILQPVHNIALLVLAEVGVLGFLLFVYILLKTFIKILLNKNKRWLFFPIFLILVTGFFDHYWLTLQQNMFLTSLIFGLTFRKKLS